VQSTVVTPTYTFTDLSVTVDGKTACGIRDTGAVVCWGTLGGGLTKYLESTKAGVITQISASSSFVCGPTAGTQTMACAYGIQAITTVAGVQPAATAFMQIQISYVQTHVYNVSIGNDDENNVLSSMNVALLSNQ
jgi:hypothetical protein